MRKSKIFVRGIFFVAVASAAGCGLINSPSPSNQNSRAPAATSTIPVPTDNNSGAGNGATVPGQGSFSVPTADALVARLQIGLQKNVTPAAGNFAKSLAQVKSNLPKSTDPTLATGFDQVQLLVYGACSDLTTGNNPIMLSKYKVDPKATIAASQAALLSAGMTMLDQYVAGLASASTATAPINSTLTSLVQQVGAVAGNTSTIAFMSVCIAANTAGSSLMGF